MSVTNKQLTVAVSGHWLLGSLPLADTRIQEALNDFRTEFVKLSDVEVHSLDGCERVTNVPEVIVPKCKIEFVVVPTVDHEAPVKRWNNRTAKEVFEAFAVVGDYRITGKLHLTTKPKDCQFALSEQLGRFFALTGASLSFRGREKPLRAPLLFANKDSVSCFQIGQPAAFDSTGGEPPSQLSALDVPAVASGENIRR